MAPSKKRKAAGPPPPPPPRPMSERLKREFRKVSELVSSLELVDKDSSKWRAFMNGPPETPFAGGSFGVAFDLDCYPFSPPSVRFLTPIYHPNVSQTGQVHAALLSGSNWCVATQMDSVIIGLVALLSEPEPSAWPIGNEGALDLYQSDPQAYADKARTESALYAGATTASAASQAQSLADASESQRLAAVDVLERQKERAQAKAEAKAEAQAEAQAKLQAEVEADKQSTSGSQHISGRTRVSRRPARSKNPDLVDVKQKPPSMPAGAVVKEEFV